LRNFKTALLMLNTAICVATAFIFLVELEGSYVYEHNLLIAASELTICLAAAGANLVWLLKYVYSS